MWVHYSTYVYIQALKQNTRQRFRPRYALANSRRTRCYNQNCAHEEEHTRSYRTDKPESPAPADAARTVPLRSPAERQSVRAGDGQVNARGIGHQERGREDSPPLSGQ